MDKKQFKYTGKANSYDYHESDFYESSNWNVCIWDGKLFDSKKQLSGELENKKQFYHFYLYDDLVVVQRTLESMHDGLGKRYVEGHYNFPIPKYVCDFIRSLKEKYIQKES